MAEEKNAKVKVIQIVFVSPSKESVKSDNPWAFAA
jgi:hypothetical protein